MDLSGRRVMVLGGSGLVGRAVARRIMDYRPAQLVLVALREGEVSETVRELAGRQGEVEIVGEWGDVFLPAELAQLDRSQILADPALRERLVADIFGELDDQILERSQFFRLLMRFRPDVVIDCINTATAFAYQNVYASAFDLLQDATSGRVDRERVERHLLTLPVPQLIRHLQIAAEALIRARVRVYVKIGTSGTGGMGLNIPYTHSEERPSRMLLTKSALAGAHSLLLFLLARTPGAPATIEIKPTATVGWRAIRYGPLVRGGRPLRRFDCPAPQPVERAFASGASGWRDTGTVLESVYIDMGENGAFGREEFETATSLGSMELITPEEIAELVVMEIEGRPTGRDIVAALDASSAGPTYRGGILRSAAIAELRRLEGECNVRSVAFEMLGPPRLTKHLYEAHVWSLLCGTVRALSESQPLDLARRASALIAEDSSLRSTIVSVGLPILVQGDMVYRGEVVVVPPQSGDFERAAFRGWVDLRDGNAARWIARARRMCEQSAGAPAGDSGSGIDPGLIGPDEPISPSRMAAWIFRFEDGGQRIKR
jgi:NAD(P)-dependent dehydrogenase (short-subunit alcohol dehydrogenase family)